MPSLAALASVVILAGCAAPPAAPTAGVPTAATAPVAAKHESPRFNVERFPISHYDQNVDRWIPPDSPGYDTPLLTSAEQQRRFAAMRDRYFGTGPRDASPWNPAFLNANVLNAASAATIAGAEARAANRADNDANGSHKVYGENFQPLSSEWIARIRANMGLAQIDADAANWHYDARRRAITVDNVLVRQLPTHDPAFLDFHLAGEGYPFDTLQDSALRPGTPVYVLARSVDGAWVLVFSPDLIGWVDARKIASVDATFVATWRQAASRRLGAVIQSGLPLADLAPWATTPTYRTSAPIGTVLPLMSTRDGGQAVMIPVADMQQRAVIRTMRVDPAAVVPMPWTITPRHMAQLMKQQIGRPYGWGNTLFYNDCSAETRSLFAPFGVWLQRHSSDQMRAGRSVDLRQADVDTRLKYLADHGRPLMTLVYIGGHVVLYLGNTQIDGKTVPMTYQNVWGLSPADNSRRNVIGGSVILPFLKTWPEDPQVQSQAGRRLFEVSVIGDGESGAGAAHEPPANTPEEMPQ